MRSLAAPGHAIKPQVVAAEAGEEAEVPAAQLRARAVEAAVLQEQPVQLEPQERWVRSEQWVLAEPLVRHHPHRAQPGVQGGQQARSAQLRQLVPQGEEAAQPPA